MSIKMQWLKFFFNWIWEARLLWLFFLFGIMFGFWHLLDHNTSLHQKFKWFGAGLEAVGTGCLMYSISDKLTHFKDYGLRKFIWLYIKRFPKIIRRKRKGVVIEAGVAEIA